MDIKGELALSLQQEYARFLWELS